MAPACRFAIRCVAEPLASDGRACRGLRREILEGSRPAARLSTGCASPIHLERFGALVLHPDGINLKAICFAEQLTGEACARSSACRSWAGSNDYRAIGQRTRGFDWQEEQTAMQFMLMIYEDEKVYGPNKSAPAMQEIVAKHMAFSRELGSRRVGGGGLRATTSATTVRTTNSVGPTVRHRSNGGRRL